MQVKRRSYNDLAGIDLLFFSLLLTPRSLTSFLQALERALNLPGNRVRLQMARTDPPPFRTPFQTGHRRCRMGKRTLWWLWLWLSPSRESIKSVSVLHRASRSSAFPARLETPMWCLSDHGMRFLLRWEMDSRWLGLMLAFDVLVVACAWCRVVVGGRSFDQMRKGSVDRLADCDNHFETRLVGSGIL